MEAPATLRIVAYHVGFGDCFLLTFHYRRERRHVLIDFGTTAGSGPGQLLLNTATDIRARTQGKLHAVVATHRHRDHIAGFAGESGRIIAGLAPEVVVQPWTENPKLSPDAAGPVSTSEGPRGFVASLRNMELVAQHVRQGHSGEPWSRALTRQLAMLSEDNLPNREAVLNLQAMGRHHRYVYCGAPDPLRAVLPGVRTRVLGPPTLLQKEGIRQQRRRDETEFWHFQAEATGVGAAGQRPLFPKAPVYTRHTAPPDAQWFLDRLQETRGDQLLAIVRALDHAINNTSVILLLEAGGRKLLFPGDAQIENWSYALSRFAKRLHDVDLYKVGHHGSLNATPRSLWKLFAKRGRTRRPGRLITLLSTLPGVHGDISRGTEVPRRRLVAELKRESTLFRTDRLGSAAMVVDMDLAARKGR